MELAVDNYLYAWITNPGYAAIKSLYVPDAIESADDESVFGSQCSCDE